ncbi:hypothetical protein BGZ46_010328 [Entomortierella lignicola]|nr:hypothetical protein BGZ46_010328 [Entomortierella lignicola]
MTSNYPRQHFNNLDQPQLQVDTQFSPEMNQALSKRTDHSHSHSSRNSPMNSSSSSRDSSDGFSDLNSGRSRPLAVVRRHSYIEPLSRLVHGRQHQRAESISQAPTSRCSSPSNEKKPLSNRNSLNVNTLGRSSEASQYLSSASASTPSSSLRKRPDSSSSSFHSATVNSNNIHANESNTDNHNNPNIRNNKARLSQFYPNNQENSSLPSSSASDGSSLSIPTSPVRSPSSSPISGAAAPALAPRSPAVLTSMHDPMMIESEIVALRSQIHRATLVLTHVVQTSSVPSPSALLDLFLVGVRVQKSRHSMPSSPLTPQPRQGESEQLEHRPPHSSNGCSCALLQENDKDGRFGTGREAAFLAAYYCADPWEFQSRIIRQIEFMQHDLQTLRQEMLEIEKRVTISKRKEMLENERARDKEWVELNERMRKVALLDIEDVEDDDPEVKARRQDSGYGQDESILKLDRGNERQSYKSWKESPETQGETSTKISSKARRKNVPVVGEGKKDKGKGKLEAQDRNDNDQGSQRMNERKEDFNSQVERHEFSSRVVSWATDYPPVSNSSTKEE